MRYIVLATDYDGTLATDGRVGSGVTEALERLRGSGRHLVLVTGREVEDLKLVFDRLDLFTYVVAENGGVLYYPDRGTIEPLAEPPNERLVATLGERGIAPLHAGHVVVATREPYDTAVLETVRDLGLELQLVFNKGAVMVLPSGVNKASGLSSALERLGMVPANVVGIGDAENDHAFLRICEASVAVANAVPSLLEEADFSTSARASEGVVELIDRLLQDDLRFLEPRLARHRIPLGKTNDGAEISIEPYGQHLLICGSSGGGKSTVTQGLLERLVARGYEFCLVDPEGDYPVFTGAEVLGSNEHVPTLDEITQTLELPGISTIINLLAVPLGERPAFFEKIMLAVCDLQVRVARPHWLVVDEAHHILPVESLATAGFPKSLATLVLVTPHPGMLVPEALAHIDGLIAVGAEIGQTVRALAKARGLAPPDGVPEALEEGNGFFWRLADDAAGGVILAPYPSETEHRRHERKYAEGELGPERSFYFRGPAGALHLRAQNLAIFLQMGDGVDDGTWLYHLRRGDYSRWFRDVIKDEDLARDAETVERAASLPPDLGRALIRAFVEARYTLPGTAPSGSHQESPTEDTRSDKPHAAPSGDSQN